MGNDRVLLTQVVDLITIFLYRGVCKPFHRVQQILYFFFHFFSSGSLVVMGMMQEFKEFALRGNVVDMAVGIVIGGAFGKIVTSLVQDIVNPVVGLFTGGVDFAEHKTLLQGEGESAVYMSWGNFLNNVFQFIIIAFAIFLVIKAINTAKKRFEAEKAAEPPAAPSPEVQLLTEIRDSLNR